MKGFLIVVLLVVCLVGVVTLTGLDQTDPARGRELVADSLEWVNGLVCGGAEMVGQHTGTFCGR